MRNEVAKNQHFDFLLSGYLVEIECMDIIIDNMISLRKSISKTHWCPLATLA